MHTNTGKKIVDTWAGTMGPNDDRPVKSDSLFYSWSTTKGDDMYDIELLVMGVQQGADYIGRIIRGFLMEWRIELGKKNN